jgi:hypothetical protein
LALLLAVRNRAGNNHQDETTPSIAATTTNINSWSTRTAIMLLTTHATLCVFWTVLAGTPTDDPFDLPFVTIMSAQQTVINAIITVTTGVAFALQFHAVEATQGASALSRTALFLPAILFLALAVSWPFRFQVPLNLQRDRGGLWWILVEWYPQVGWPCVNSAVIAIGHGALIYALSGTTASGVEPGTEREALLGT